MASAPCCASCHQNDACFLCSCIPPAFPVCGPCFSQNHQLHIHWSLGVSNPVVVQPPPQAMHLELSNASCETCNSSATLVCLCTQPIKCFCDSDIQTHISKNRALPHYSIPAIHLGIVPGNPEEFLAFRTKQLMVDDVRARMITAREEMARKRREAVKVFNTLRELMETVQTEFFELFDGSVGKIDQHIAAFERAIPSLRFNPNYPPSTLLEHYISTQNNPALESRPFEFLKIAFTGLSEIKDSIESMGSIRTNESLFGAPPVLVPRQDDREALVGEIFPMVTSMRLVMFGLPTCLNYTEKIFHSRHRPKLDEYTQIVLTSPRDIFCVGGKESNFVCTIKAPSGFIQQESPMAQKRGNPGLAFSPPFVYVFGGAYRSSDHRSCEKYNLSAKSWMPVGQMLSGRSCFTPCGLQDRIMLFGGGAPRPEYYLFDTDACYSLPFNMPSSGPAISFLRRGEVYFISGQGLYRFRNNGIENLNRECKFEANSHVVPVQIGEKIYFSDWTVDIKLISLDLNSLQWQLLTEYPAGRF